LSIYYSTVENPLNIFDKIPTSDPAKSIALNALAFSAGALISMTPLASVTYGAIGASVTYGAIGYSLFLAGKELSTNDAKLSLEKTAHVGMALLSFTAGSFAGGLLYNAWLSQSLFVHAMQSRSVLSGAMGLKNLIVTAGVYLPVTAFIGTVAYRAFTALRDYQTSPEQSLRPIKKLIVNSSVIGYYAAIIGCSWVKIITKKDYEPVQKAKELIVDATDAFDNDQEFEKYLMNDVVRGGVSLTGAKGNERFMNYYNTQIKDKAQKAIDFFKTAGTGPGAYTHAQNALFCKKVLEHYPIVDDGMKKELSALFSKFLQAMPQAANSDEDDALFYVREFLQDADWCRERLNELQLHDSSRRSHAEVLYHGLVGRGLDTRGKLRDAGYFGNPGKEKLKKIMKNEVDMGDQVNVFKSTVESFLLTAKKTAKKTKHTASETFFNYSLSLFAVCSVVSNPISTLVAAQAGYKAMNNEGENIKKAIKEVFPYDPKRELSTRFALRPMTSDHLGIYATALMIFTSPLVVGAECGVWLQQKISGKKE
jgi:hypothetical protein